MLILLALLAVSVASDVFVDTEYGRMKGELTNNYRAFRGIPFSQPPVGEYRWAAPLPAFPWAPATYDATYFRDGCIGGSNRWGVLDLNYTEDCLYLNVWAPPTAMLDNGTVPVMVWIYGGGFMLGAASDLMFRGGIYANRTDNPVVLVTVNYRLGALGWMATNAGDGMAGNYGLQDQQAALKWVQANIRAFGGDPKRVTIFGQSAGGMSVITHIVSPQSQGLFTSAIASSAVGLHYRTPAENAPLAKTIATLLLCHDGDLTCMRAKSAKAIKAIDIAPEYLAHISGERDNFGLRFLPWMPTVDGVHLTGQHMDVLKTGQFAKVPLVIGTVRNETAAWVPAINSTLEYHGIVRVQFLNESTKVLNEYDDASTSSYTKVTSVTTDYLVTCYTRMFAKLYQEHNVPTSLYQFMHVPSSAGADPVNRGHKQCHRTSSYPGEVCHAADNGFVFHSPPAVDSVGFTAEEDVLSEAMRDAYVKFAYNPGSHDAFPPFNSTSLVSWQWGTPEVPTGGRVERAFMADRCDFWETLGWRF